MLRIVIGTANFGQKYGISSTKVEKQEISKILNYAWKKKIRLIDTANFYGKTEKIIGKINTKKFEFISKIKLTKKILNNPELLKTSVINTLSDLKISKLYAVLIHNPSIFKQAKNKKIFEVLKELKLKRLVKKIGASIYTNQEINFVLKKRLDIDIIQLPSNIFDRRYTDLGWFKTLKRRKIEIHVRSIFLQGLILKSSKPKSFNKWKKNFKKFEKWLDFNKISKVEACLNYIYKQKNINYIIIGIDRLNQLKQIMNIKIKKNINFPKFISKRDTQLINPTKW